MHTYDDAHFFTSVPANGGDIKIEHVAGIIAQFLE
jgi:hypothetical protein